MKIGILTQPLHTNYGGLLQNYALQQILLRNGHRAETMNWNVPVNSLYFRLANIKRNLLSFFFPSKYKSSKYNLTEQEKRIIQKNTDFFINKYIIHTSTITKFSEFSKQAEKGQYEGYIVGSDQCWRPCYNYFLPSMFLSFVEKQNVKRIAYAVSFGSDRWEYNTKLETKCAALAKKFDLITVREDSGIFLCKKYLGLDAIQVLDPTMLLNREDYEYLVELENEQKSSGSLFYYILDPNDSKKTFIDRTAKKLSLKPFQVLPKYQAETRTKEVVKNRIEECVFPNVTSWLRAFMDSDMTIVDSFHGLVFSIIFNKPFWVIGNKKRGNTRILSLLKLFNLESRFLDEENLGDIEYSSSIDWPHVNEILDSKRSESLNLLLKSLCL